MSSLDFKPVFLNLRYPAVLMVMALKNRDRDEAATMSEVILQECLDSYNPAFILSGIDQVPHDEAMGIMVSLLPHAPRHRRDAQIAQLASMMIESPSPVIERLLTSLVT